MPATDENEVNENEVNQNEIESNGNTSDDAVQDALDLYELREVSEPEDTVSNQAELDAPADNDSALDDPEQSRKTAWLLIGGGVVLAILLVLRGPRKLIAWLVPIGLIGAGLAILAQQRRAKLNAVAARVLAEMDGLGPIDKIEVLIAVGREQFPGKKAGGFWRS